MNASFTEKKYESSYVCIAQSILGIRSKKNGHQNRSNKEATTELLRALLFIVLKNNKGGHNREKKSTSDLFTLSLLR